MALILNHSWFLIVSPILSNIDSEEKIDEHSKETVVAVEPAPSFQLKVQKIQSKPTRDRINTSREKSLMKPLEINKVEPVQNPVK